MCSVVTVSNGDGVFSNSCIHSVHTIHESARLPGEDRITSLTDGRLEPHENGIFSWRHFHLPWLLIKKTSDDKDAPQTHGNKIKESMSSRFGL